MALLCRHQAFPPISAVQAHAMHHDAPQASLSRSGIVSRLMLAIPIIAVVAGLLLVAFPILGTLLRSLNAEDNAWTHFTLANYAAMFNDPAIRQGALNTLITGFCVTIFASLIGCALAWIIARTDVPGRNTFEILNLIPFFFSPYVGAMSWLYLAAPNSGIIPKQLAAWLGTSVTLPNIYSVGGVVWVLSLFYAPYVYLFVIGPMRSMDGALEDAARVHGAGFWTTTRRITMPLLAPALISGALVVFVTSGGLFDVPMSIAAPKNINMIPTDIFRAVQYPTDFGRAASIAAVMMLVTILIAVFQQRFINARRFDTISGKGYRPRPVALGPLGRALAMGFQLLYFVTAVVLPLMALIMVSLSPLWTGFFRPDKANLSNFHYVISEFSMTQTAVMNSLFIGVVGATIGVGLGALQAYFVRRTDSRLARIAEPILSLPIGIPGIIIGLGFLILLIGTPLYATIWIIIIAGVAHFFPLALRNISAMLLSINSDLESSARASGASWLQAMRYVMLPLLLPALIASWLLLFIILIRELGATILLYAQGTETISVALVILSEQNFGYVAALAVIQVTMLLVGFFLMRRSSGAIMGR
jgi:iron(III) transport system permease protein